jgi:hypothetical protein
VIVPAVALLRAERTHQRLNDTGSIETGEPEPGLPRAAAA